MGAVMKDVSSSCTTLEHRREYVDLPFPENKGYLTEKAEHALKFPKVILAVSRKTGKTYTINQRQTAVTGTIRADELTHAYLWDYKAEVRFDMTTVPTSGIATPYLSGSGEY